MLTCTILTSCFCVIIYRLPAKDRPAIPLSPFTPNPNRPRVVHHPALVAPQFELCPPIGVTVYRRHYPFAECQIAYWQPAVATSVALRYDVRLGHLSSSQAKWRRITSCHDQGTPPQHSAITLQNNNLTSRRSSSDSSVAKCCSTCSCRSSNVGSLQLPLCKGCPCNLLSEFRRH